MPKAEALAEAKRWLRTLTGYEIDRQIAALPRGLEPVSQSAGPGRSAHPYDHPYYWAAFILIGDAK
jgi:CHAT domain-containing protein